MAPEADAGGGSRGVVRFFSDRAERLIYLAAGMFYGVFIVRTAFTINGRLYFSLFDDAMVSMTYARNLAHGHGLVWNVGGPRIEGYTNFLWTLWMAALQTLPVSDSMTSLLVMLSGLVILLVLVKVAGAVAKRIFDGNRIAVLIAMASTAFCYPIAYWTLRGMEVGFLALIVLASVLVALQLRESARTRDLVVLVILLTAAVLTRTDALVSVVIIVAFVAWVTPRDRRWRIVGVLVVAIALVLVGQTIFRIAYYGQALPNTYYLKLTGAPLSQRLIRGTYAFGLIFFVSLWPFAVASALTIKRRRNLRPELVLLAALALGQVAYSVYAGGDAWEGLGYANRYLCIGLPPAIVLASGGIASLADTEPARLARWLRWLVGVFAAIAVAWTVVVFGTLTSLESYFHDVGVAKVKIGTGLLGVVALVGLVAVASACRSDRGIWFTTARRVVGHRSVAFALTAAAALTIASGAYGYAKWAQGNAAILASDQLMTRDGVHLRSATLPGATVAVVAAGAQPYFDHRRSIDLLGLSDRVIAHMHEVTRFFPGHNKWDYSYSIGQLRPDVVTGLWMETAADRAYLRSLGYVLEPNGLWVRADSRQALPNVGSGAPIG